MTLSDTTPKQGRRAIMTDGRTNAVVNVRGTPEALDRGRAVAKLARNSGEPAEAVASLVQQALKPDQPESFHAKQRTEAERDAKLAEGRQVVEAASLAAAESGSLEDVRALRNAKDDLAGLEQIWSAKVRAANGAYKADLTKLAEAEQAASDLAWFKSDEPIDRTQNGYIGTYTDKRVERNRWVITLRPTALALVRAVTRAENSIPTGTRRTELIEDANSAEDFIRTQNEARDSGERVDPKRLVDFVRAESRLPTAEEMSGWWTTVTIDQRESAKVTLNVAQGQIASLRRARGVAERCNDNETAKRCDEKIADLKRQQAEARVTLGMKG